MRTRVLFPFALLFSTLFIQGCITAAIISTAAISTKVATDPRRIGIQLDDIIIQFRVNRALAADKKIKKESRINAISYHGKILLVGQTLNNDLKFRAKQIVAEATNITEVYDEIRQGNPINFYTVSSDFWITTKVYAQLIGSSEVKLSNLKIITENGEVFLFGLVTIDEGKAAANIASLTKGVRRVVTAFTYVQ